MKALTILTALVFISLMMVNVQGAITTYYVREDFNSIDGFNVNPSDANITVENGEVVIGTPPHFEQNNYGTNIGEEYINKTESINKELDAFTVRMNLKMRDFGEVEWNSSFSNPYTISEATINIYIYSDSGSQLKIRYSMTLEDDNSSSNLWWSSSGVSVWSSDDDTTFYGKIFAEENGEHNQWYESAVELKFERATPLSYMVTINRYESYNFTGEKTPVTNPAHFTGNITKVEIGIHGKEYLYYHQTKPQIIMAKSNFVYLFTGSGEEITPQKTVEATNMTLYLLPAIILGVGIFTAITGNPRYVYLVLTAFLLFGVMAIIDSQYILSVIGFISTGIYGYNLKKGGGLLG